MCAKSLAHRKILSEIAAKGPLSFARFLELALYDAETGYYASGRAKVGRHGDFFTNVSVGPVFGRVLAEQFREMWSRLGEPGKFALVEQGANDGQLALDVLSALPEAMQRATDYWIVEPFPALRQRQEQVLRAWESRVRWVDDLRALPVFEGVHFSNELVDALPFHLVQCNGNEWKQLYVAAEQERLIFEAKEPEPALDRPLKTLPRRAKGTIAELRPGAGSWVLALAERIHRGFVLIIDYGFPRDELLASHRTEGTYCCFRAHRRDSQPLEDPGEKDISAHVDFTALAEAALAAGLRLEGFTDQHHFLVGASQELLARLNRPPDAFSQKSLRALQTLLHPESMGTQFRYLALSKGVEPSPRLSGFRFARDPRVELFSEFA